MSKETTTEIPAVIEHHTSAGSFTGPVEETPIRGLVVSPRVRLQPMGQQWRFTGGWGVVHARSGFVISGSLDVGLGQAREAAELLGAHGIDWTEAGDDVRASAPIRELVREVVCEVQQAVEEGRPVRPKTSSWRQCPPGWEIVLRDGNGDEIETYTDATYVEAEDNAVELGNAHRLHDPSTHRSEVVDITVQRATDYEWELTCAGRDCPQILIHPECLGPIRSTSRRLLAEMAAVEAWRRIDQRRWLCPDCRPLYHHR